ncbi:hypothetical protein HN51_058806, partial [Arachis hypogaea]
VELRVPVLLDHFNVCYLHISGTISAYESLTLQGYDVVAVVLEDHGLLNEGRIMSYICEQASCSSATPCSKRCHYMVISDNLLLYDSSLLVFLKAQSTEVVALLFDACANYASRSRCNSYSTKRQFKVKTVARIVESDAGKVICREAERIKPAAVVLGSRGRNLIQSVLQGSVGEYYYHHYKAAPVVIVPGKDVRDASIL